MENPCKALCDRCRAAMNGSGYYVCYEAVTGGLRMAIISSHDMPPGDWQRHFCGRSCLMLGMNELMDIICDPQKAEKQSQDEIEEGRNE